MSKVVLFIILLAVAALLSPFCGASSEQMNQPQELVPSSEAEDREKEAMTSLLLHVLAKRNLDAIYATYPQLSRLISRSQIPKHMSKKDSWLRYRGIDSRVPAFGSFFSPSPSDNSEGAKVFRYG